MQERNEYLEMDGLYFESDTHEWFNDKSSTGYAHNEDLKGVSLPNFYCFIVRDKDNGKYTRVIMDSDDNKPTYESNSIEGIGSYIDKIKIFKHFNNEL